MYTTLRPDMEEWLEEIFRRQYLWSDLQVPLTYIQSSVARSQILPEMIAFLLPEAAAFLEMENPVDNRRLYLGIACRRSSCSGSAGFGTHTLA